MERKEFLSTLGISLAAICAGCGIASCGSNPKNGDPSPGGGNTNPTAFSANLSTELTTVGQSKVAGGIIVVRIAAGNTADAFTAVQVNCTHEGTAINYNNAQGIFICPNHGSEFSKQGAVLLGPAAVALKKFSVNINGNMLTVTG